MESFSEQLEIAERELSWQLRDGEAASTQSARLAKTVASDVR